MEAVPSIIFPHLGVELGYFPTGFTIFGNFYVAFYGVIIAIGMIACVALIMYLAGKTNQNKDNYIDMAILAIIFGIIGARIYYILFSLPYYIENPGEIINIRNGGLAIYGGIIAGVITIAIVCRVKKISFLRVMDTGVAGLALAQAIGRWANFVNREAFGEYTDSLFAMQIRLSEVNQDAVTDLMRENMVTIDGVQYIQVAPTFLYESIWCLAIVILILVFRKYQRYNGEVALWYIGGYALGRAWIEGLRTDALYIGSSSIPVSQLLSVALFAGAFVILLINRIRLIRKTWQPEFTLVLPDGAPGTKAYDEERLAKRKAAKKEKYKEKHGEEKKDASEWETYTVQKDDTNAEQTVDVKAETDEAKVDNAAENVEETVNVPAEDSAEEKTEV